MNNRHIGKGLYYGSYRSPRILLWSIGVIIFLVMMGTAFLGYTLIWGAFECPTWLICFLPFNLP